MRPIEAPNALSSDTVSLRGLGRAAALAPALLALALAACATLSAP